MLECIRSDGELSRYLCSAFVLSGPFEYGLDAQKEFLHAEGFGDVVVGPNFSTLRSGPLSAISRSGTSAGLLVDAPHLAGEGETVHARHHDIDKAEIITSLPVCRKPFRPIDGQGGVKSVHHQMLLEDETKVRIVFEKENRLLAHGILR